MVVWGQGCAEPLGLIGRLAEQRADLGAVRCFTGMTVARPLRPEHLDHLQPVSYLGGLPGADVVPSHYSNLPRLLTDGPLKADVVLIQAPPPDAAGRYSLGLAVDYIAPAAAQARRVIVEVNDDVPWTHGPFLESRHVAAVVSSEASLPEPPAAVPDEAGRLIARRVAELVPDGATLQMGIGRLPELILGELRAHRGLSVHSGVIGDAVVDLVMSGAIAGDLPVSGERIVTGLLHGSAKLRSFVDRNPGVALRPISYTHDPEVLARQHRLVAINGALEVDLSGAVNTESLDGRYLGGVGGAVDFARGAGRSSGGVSVIALPSTAGSRSRIVSRLSGPATIPRSDVGVIVTEHGIADLRGRTLRERRELVLAIADPTHRATLEQDL